MNNKSQFYRLGKKIKRARKNWFRFIQKVKLTIKIISRISNINICPYLKLPIPKLHRQFLRIISQNPEYVKDVCKDLNKSFHFACRRRMINQFFGIDDY